MSMVRLCSLSEVRVMPLMRSSCLSSESCIWWGHLVWVQSHVYGEVISSKCTHLAWSQGDVYGELVLSEVKVMSMVRLFCLKSEWHYGEVILSEVRVTHGEGLSDVHEELILLEVRVMPLFIPLYLRSVIFSVEVTWFEIVMISSVRSCGLRSKR